MGAYPESTKDKEKVKFKYDKSFFKFSIMCFHTKSIWIKKISLININEKSQKHKHEQEKALSNNGHALFAVKFSGKSKQWNKNYEIYQSCTRKCPWSDSFGIIKVAQKNKKKSLFLPFQFLSSHKNFGKI